MRNGKKKRTSKERDQMAQIAIEAANIVADGRQGGRVGLAGLVAQVTT